jgi:pilus assembly protein CpaE
VGVKHLSKALDTLSSIGIPSEKLHIVLNRADSKVGLDPHDVEKVLKIKVDSMIPSSRMVPASLNQGRPVYLQEPASDVAKSIDLLAGKLLPEVLMKNEDTRPTSARKRLFKR